VHPHPEDARSDGDQSLDFASFIDVMTRVGPFAEAAGRTMHAPSHERA
jgi:3-deoxy-D-arabino-heptulosonate 7-phosphate (DAHP) synthase